MIFYKDLKGGLFVDPNTDIRKDLKEITEAEFKLLSNPPKTPEQLQSEAIAHYKSIYLGVVQDKLKALDYDSLATVKLWEGDPTFGAEATRILVWYKAIIAKNYALLTAGVPLTDKEYLAEIASVAF